jgi:hypothetical protein
MKYSDFLLLILGRVSSLHPARAKSCVINGLSFNEQLKLHRGMGASARPQPNTFYLERNALRKGER